MFLTVCFGFKFIVKPIGQEERFLRVKLVRKFKVNLKKDFSFESLKG